jgi:hypothetical protein
MATSFNDSTPNMKPAEGLHIEIKTRSVCDRRKVDPWIYSENWSTDVLVVGYATGHDEVKLWHPGDPVPQELTRALANGSPIIAYDAPFQRAIFTNIMGPRYDWPIPPLEQWVCAAAMAAALALPQGLAQAAKAMGIAEHQDREAHSLLLRMAQPRSKTKIPCSVCGMMTCGHHEMFKTSLVWWTDAEDLARLDSYCIQDVRTEGALFDVLRPLSQAERENWLRDQVVNEPGTVFDTLLPELAARSARSPTVTTNVITQSAAEIVPDWIRDHVRLIHLLAQPLVGQGKVIATCFGEDPDEIDPKTGNPGRSLRPRVIHAAVGEANETLKGLAQYIKQQNYNVYMPLAVFRPDLPSWQKGFERDVVACLGIVADFDDPDAAQWAERLPIPPNYVLQTSAGRFQAFYLFDKPEALKVVKPVAERLKAFAKCDHGTSDISHVWRVPGALNWPNAKKVAEGRAREPQLVRVEKFDGGRTSLQALSDALPPGEAAPERKDSTTPRKAARARPAATDDRAAPEGKVRSLHKAAIDGTSENLEALQRMLSLSPELQAEIKQPRGRRS